MGELDGTAQGQNSDRGRRRFDRAGLGNGKATAVTFAREGAQVFCVDRNQAAAQQTVDINRFRRRRGGRRSPPMLRVPAMSRRGGCLLKAYGRIDVLDNNVGIAEWAMSSDVSEASWDHVFNVNLKALPRHEARHPGDGAARRRLDHQYLVDRLDPPSRHLLCHLCHHQGRDEPDDATTAVEYAPKNIRVNAVLPA